MAVNKSFEYIPTADYFFTRDTRFTNEFKDKLALFEGQVIVGNGTMVPSFAKRVDTTAYISGAAAIEAAVRLGYTTIYLLGADGHHSGGAHWHENYTTLANAPNYQKFDGYYADAMKGVEGAAEVYNLSPNTRITAVPTKDIEEVLNA